MDLTGILLIALAVGLGLLLFAAIALGWIPKNDGAGASLTALHDLQGLDKQNATEIVIEQKAGKRWTEQESGDTDMEEGADPKEAATPGAGVDVNRDAEGDRNVGPVKGHQSHES
jgi:hypothetical protein